jgi:hypothetical protein
MRRLKGRKVFTVGKRTFRGEDVLLAAYLWGEINALEGRIREELGCLKALEAGGGELPEAEIDAAADAWRYERDLLSADDAQTWLEERKLDTDEWLDYINRTVACALAGRKPGAVRITAEEVDSVAYCEAVCSSLLADVGDRLAGLAAVHDRAERDGIGKASKAELRAIVNRLPGAVKKDGILGIGRSETMVRAELIARLMLASEEFIDRIAAPAALDREIEAHALDWTRLDCETVIFPAEEVAREALLLVREDGLPLAKAAAVAKARVEKMKYLLDDVESPLKDRLVGALPGQIVGPVREQDAYVLVSVLDRVEPKSKDVQIRDRARNRVVGRTIRSEVAKRVRWHEPL